MQSASSEGSPARRTLLELATLEKRDYQATLQRILQADADALDVDRVSYWRLSENGVLTGELGWDRRLEAFESGAKLREREFPVYFRAIREEQVILAHDARLDPRTRELAHDYLALLDITSLMDVPVWSRGRVVGVLCHEHRGPSRVWSSRECDLALGVAQAIATTYEASARDEAEKRARRALFLSNATEVLSEILDLEEVPRQIVQLALPELGDWCVLEEIDAWGKPRVMAALHREPRHLSALLELLARKPGEPAGDHFLRRVLANGRPLLFPGINDEVLRRFGLGSEESRQLVRRLGAKSVLLVPLAARGRVSAALTVVSGERALGREELQLAEEFARRAAVHLDNARLYREARDAVAARDELLAVASHELSSPLTSLGLTVDVLRRGLMASGNPSVQSAAELVQRQQQRLARLVHEMLDVTRIQSRRLTLNRERLNLADAVRAVCSTFEPSFAAKDSALRCHLDEEVWGEWDRGRIERLLENLLSNALKFGEGKPVDVFLRARAEGAELQVRDQGIGIPLERQREIFERFKRAVSSEHSGGLGLGLFISRGIVRAHGGDIGVSSQPGKGTTFTVFLPWSSEPPDEAAP